MPLKASLKNELFKSIINYFLSVLYGSYDLRKIKLISSCTNNYVDIAEISLYRNCECTFAYCYNNLITARKTIIEILNSDIFSVF